VQHDLTLIMRNLFRRPAAPWRTACGLEIDDQIGFRSSDSERLQAEIPASAPGNGLGAQQMRSLAEEVSARLGKELEAGTLLSQLDWRDEITRAHMAATTEAERVLCLGLFNLVMDIYTERFAAHANPEDLSKLRKLIRKTT
jgi:hypothetical protein